MLGWLALSFPIPGGREGERKQRQSSSSTFISPHNLSEEGPKLDYSNAFCKSLHLLDPLASRAGNKASFYPCSLGLIQR